MTVSLLLYACTRVKRSSRLPERESGEDVAFRVIAANQKR
jgi:hypothetical protein